MSSPSLEILYQDDDYVIINKPPDLMIDGKNEITVEKLLYREFPEVEKLHFVHQLDYATSGILCLAKNSRACGDAGKLFSQRLAKKTYVALVHGHILPDTIDTDVAIIPHPQFRFKMIPANEDSIGKVSLYDG
jgi:23S rRNA-/tRNA-specific pseudouridylate synthase